MAGSDLLKGGKAADFLDGGEGADEFSGGGGADLADYRSRDTPVVVKIDDTPNDGAVGEGDNVHTDAPATTN